VYVHEIKTHETIQLASEDEVSKNEGQAPYVRCKTDVYHDIQKEKRVLERLEKEMKQQLVERERILQAFASDPLARDVVKAKRLKELEAQNLELEAAWFASHDRLEIFEKELKTAKLEHG
jgi:hypothetical protein